MSLLDLLMAENVAEFNDTRGERTKVDLFGADLAGLSLRGVDLSGADVDKADLSGSDLTEAGLYKARMNGIDASDAKLVDCLGARVKLREAWLEGADLSGSDLANADLSEAVLTRTVAAGTRLAAGKLKGAELTEARWTECDLTGVHLSRVILTNADLSRSTLTEAVGGEVQAAGARLDAVVASQARLPGSSFVGASLVGARFDGASLVDCDFTDADLRGVDFTGADLANAVFTGAKLAGAVMAEASLEGVDIGALDLTDVDLSGLDADLLGLTDAQREVVTAVGIPVNPDAMLRPKDVVGACNGGLIAGSWINDDGEETSTVRFVACTPDGVRTGVLPVMASSVLARSAVATGDGVSLVLTRERPGGTTIDVFDIGPQGRLRASKTRALGYPPLVPPVLQRFGAGFLMYGLARRGPTLVISGPTPEGFGARSSKPLPTARGFLGLRQPFLLCKGGVLLPCTQTGVGDPLSAPDGFPGKLSCVAHDGEGWRVAWVEPPVGKHPGSVKVAQLVKRGPPVVGSVNRTGAVLSMDAADADGSVWLTWVELHGLGDTRPFLHRLDRGKPQPLPFEDVDQVRFVTGPDGQLALLLVTEDERIVFADLHGDRLGALER